MTMTEPVEGLYFDWLRSKVLDSQPHSPNYHDLLRILYSTAFIVMPHVHGDHDRAADGVELRINFLTEFKMDPDPYWRDGPCSVFEMLVALAIKAEFQTDIPYRDWFWKFIENLELNEFRVISDPRDLREIEEKLNTFIWRNYHANGYGGIFPMRSPPSDQRNTEIWKQFFEYLDDQGL